MSPKWFLRVGLPLLILGIVALINALLFPPNLGLLGGSVTLISIGLFLICAYLYYTLPKEKAVLAFVIYAVFMGVLGVLEVYLVDIAPPCVLRGDCDKNPGSMNNPTGIYLGE